MNIVILTSHGRSGSLFLQSLFDSHHEVISFPIFFNYPKWVEKRVEKALCEFLENNIYAFKISHGFLNDIQRNNILLGEHGQDDPEVKKSEFIRNFYSSTNLQKNSFVTREQFVRLLHQAYGLACGYDLKKIKYALLHFHTYENGDHYRALSDFPELKFLASCRDPRKSVLSVVQQYSTNYPNLSKKSSEIIAKLNSSFFIHSINCLIKFSSLLKKNNCLIIDLEVLHNLQERGMKKISDWLEIKFSDTLVNSTFLGLSWNGNRGDGKPISGFKPSNNPLLWPNYFKKKTINSINYQVYKYLITLQYPLNEKIIKKEKLEDLLPNIIEVFSLSLETIYLDIKQILKRNYIPLKLNKYLREFYIPVLIVNYLIKGRAVFFMNFRIWNRSKIFLREYILLDKEKKIIILCFLKNQFNTKLFIKNILILWITNKYFLCKFS